MHAQNTATRQIVINDIEIDLTHTRTKSFRMRVTRDGKVKVSVPTLMSFEDATHVVEDHIDWVEEQLEKQSGCALSAVPLREATEVALWGVKVPFTLVLENGRSRMQSELGNDGFVIHAPADVTEEDLRGAVDRLLVKELGSRVAQLAPSVESRVGKHAAKWRYRRMVSRWGSCNVKTANITLNTVLAELDPKYLEYVMCHELCHLWEQNHDRHFYARLEAACPSWKKLRSELNAQ